MTRLPKKYRHQGLSPEDIKIALEEDQAEAKRRDIYRAERVREARTYRYARRAGWRLLNEQLVREGNTPLSWATFNQPMARHQVGSRPSLYTGARVRHGKNWDLAFHHGEKKRRFRQEQKRGLHAALV